MTPEEALNHPWILKTAEVPSSQQVLRRLALFKRPNLFQKEILLLLAGLLKSKDIKEIRDTFSAIDLDSSGAITLNELKAAFSSTHNQQDLEEILKQVDFDDNGEINYSEFVSSTLDRTLLSRHNLLKVYRYLLDSG